MTAQAQSPVTPKRVAAQFVSRSTDKLASDSIFRILLALLCTLFVSSCSDSTRPDQPQLTPVAAALNPSVSTLPVHYAAAAGIFARHGLDVQITETQDLSIAMQAMVAGDFDITQSLPTLALIGAEKGLGFQVVSGMGHSATATNVRNGRNPTNQWVTADPELDAFTELDGKTIGTASLTGINTDSMKFLLMRNGVDPDNVTFVQIPFASMGDQLAAGRVHAVVAIPPFTSEMEARGFSLHEDVVFESLKLASDGKVRGGVSGLFVASQKMVADNPSAIVAWRASVAESMQYLNDHPEQAREQLMQWLKTPADVANRMAVQKWNPVVTADDLEPFVVICREVGTIKSDVDVDALMWQAN